MKRGKVRNFFFLSTRKENQDIEIFAVIYTSWQVEINSIVSYLNALKKDELTMHLHFSFRAIFIDNRNDAKTNSFRVLHNKVPIFCRMVPSVK